MQYFQVDCSKCELCCKFFLDVGNKLSLAELSAKYPFNEEMCDLYFTQKNGKYLVSEKCKHLTGDDKCKLHQSPQRHISCILYPLVLCRRHSKVALCIDRNCPEVKKYLAANALPKIIARANEILSKYKRPVYLPNITELRNCGYKLLVLQSDY